MLMPREEINKKIYKGMRTMALGTFPAKSSKTDPSLKPLGFDKDRALQLLAEDGWQDTNRDGFLEKDGKKFGFEVLYPPGAPETDRVALIFRESLKSVGIDMNIRTLEWTVFLKQIMEDKFDSFILGITAGVDTDPYQMWHSSQTKKGGTNRVGFKNEEADKIMEEARATLDKEKRHALYRKLSLILADEAPVLFLFESADLSLITKRFQGVLPIGKLGLDSTRWFTPQGLAKYND